VDASRDGWVAVRMRGKDIRSAETHQRFRDLLSAAKDVSVVAVDMPIGLPKAEEWPRPPDRAAKAFIGARRSSVFVVPPLEALEAPTYPEAVSHCRERGLPALSQQAYALRRKILEVAESADDPRVHEVHPEVSFAAMHGAPLRYSKRSWNGHHERRAIIGAAGIQIPDDLGDLGQAGVDDVLDAIAAGWTAGRIAAGDAEWLPTDAPADAARIWY
jgi:predicted RNase H-like nuclease